MTTHRTSSSSSRLAYGGAKVSTPMAAALQAAVAGPIRGKGGRFLRVRPVPPSEQARPQAQQRPRR